MPGSVQQWGCQCDLKMSKSSRISQILCFLKRLGSKEFLKKQSNLSHLQTYQEWCSWETGERSRCTRCSQETPESRFHPSFWYLIFDICIIVIRIFCVLQTLNTLTPGSFPKERGLQFLFGPWFPEQRERLSAIDREMTIRYQHNIETMLKSRRQITIIMIIILFKIPYRTVCMIIVIIMIIMIFTVMTII